MLRSKQRKNRKHHRASRRQVSVQGSGFFSTIKPYVMQGFNAVAKPKIVDATKGATDELKGLASSFVPKLFGKGVDDENRKTKGQELLSKYLGQGLTQGKSKMDETSNDFLKRYINKTKVGKGLNVI